MPLPCERAPTRFRGGCSPRPRRSRCRMAAGTRWRTASGTAKSFSGPSAEHGGPPGAAVPLFPSRFVMPLGRVVATERRPNTPHEFHFWTAIDSPVGIGTIVRVEGTHAVEGHIPRVYGIVVEAFSYTDLQSPLHDVIGHDGSPEGTPYTSTERA